MGNYVVCPNRDSQRVSLEVCFSRCEMKHNCQEFREVPRADMEATAKKLNIPLRSLRELERVIDVEAEVKTEGEGTVIEVEATPVMAEDKRNSSSSECGKSPVSSCDDKRFRSEGANDFCKLPVNVEVINPGDDKAKRAMELYEKLLLLKGDIGAKFIEMGEVLNEFYDHKYYLDVGYKDWEQFCAEALDFSAHWALDIRKIALKKTQLKLSDRDVAEVGVKKMAQLLPVMTDKRTADHWIKEAKKPGVTTEGLITKIRVARGKITQAEAEILPEKILFSLFKEQKTIVDLALQIASHIDGSEKKGHLLADVICPSFLAEYPPGYSIPSKPEIVIRLLGRFESAFKVRFEGEMIDTETGEIIMRTS